MVSLFSHVRKSVVEPVKAGSGKGIEGLLFPAPMVTSEVQLQRFDQGVFVDRIAVAAIQFGARRLDQAPQFRQREMIEIGHEIQPVASITE